MIQKIFSMLVLLMAVSGAWAQSPETKIYSVDFSDYTSYPFYNASESATVENGLLVLTNSKVYTVKYDVQPEIGRPTPITAGKCYRIAIEYKSTVGGPVNVVLGTQDWNENTMIGAWWVPITVSDNFQTLEATYLKCKYGATDNHILFQFGDLVGTVYIKKVEVYEFDYVDVTSVTLSSSTATMTVDKKVALTATVAPDNATEKIVKWSVGGTNADAVKLYTDEACTTEVGSDATSALTVYAKGMSAGEATVKAESGADATKSATCTITVNPTFSATLKEGTEDFDKWTISPAKAAEGSPVTVTYSGEKKVKSVKAVKKGGAPDPQAVPLTIEAITPGIISISNPKEGMQYSKNGGAKTAATTSIDVATGDKVQFYGNGTSITSYSGTIITGSGNGFTCKVYGNIMSLVDEEGFATATTLSVNNTFYRLFYGNTTLTDASGLLLPATELAPSCYNQMFMGCTALTAAPALPATQLAENCYYRMFYNCTALTAAPELPATKLAAECYNQMFRLCTNLTAAPALPATELANSCYRSMFMGCTALTTAPVLPATTLAEYCYYQMFTNCSNLTTVPSDLPATTLVEYCYYQMFSSCTSLTTAPVLPATTLVDHCYYQMFDSCSKLATVTSLAESGINTESSTTNWLKNTGTQAQGTKIVYTVSTANWPEGNSGIPTGWMRVNVDN